MYQTVPGIINGWGFNKEKAKKLQLIAREDDIVSAACNAWGLTINPIKLYYQALFVCLDNNISCSKDHDVSEDYNFWKSIYPTTVERRFMKISRVVKGDFLLSLPVSGLLQMRESHALIKNILINKLESCMTRGSVVASLFFKFFFKWLSFSQI